MGVKFISSGGDISVTSGSGTANRVVKFTSATAVEDTNLTATGTLLHVPTGLLTFGAGSAPDLAIPRSSAGNLAVAGGAVGTTNLLILGSSGLLLGSGRDVAWAATSEPNAVPDISVKRQAAGNIMVVDSGGSNLLQVGSSGLLMRAGGQLRWSSTTDPTGTVDSGIRRDAAGSLSLSDGGAGHVTGFGVGTTTPNIVVNSVANSGSGAAIQARHASGTAFLSAAGTTAWMLLHNPTGTADQRVASLRLTAGVVDLHKYTDGAAVTAYLSANLATDVVTFGSADVAGLTLNPGTGHISLPIARLGNATGVLVINHANATNLLMLGSSGLLLGSSRDVAWTATSEPNAAADVSLKRQAAGNIMVVDSGASNLLQLGSSGLLLGSARAIKWGTANNPAGTADVGILREAANTLRVTDGAASFGSLMVGLDPGAGVASSLTLTGANNTETSRSTGVGSIKFADASSRDNVGFLKIYVGATAVYLPAFIAN